MSSRRGATTGIDDKDDDKESIVSGLRLASTCFRFQLEEKKSPGLLVTLVTVATATWANIHFFASLITTGSCRPWHRFRRRYHCRVSVSVSRNRASKWLVSQHRAS